MITEEIAYINGLPKKIVVFLHGYIDSFDHIDEKIAKAFDGIDNIAVHIPKSPIISEVYDKKFQWYSMHRFDPNDDRKTVATLEEAVDIYSKMKPGIIEASDMIERYIDNLLNEYQLSRKDLIICGYSQGATLAIYLALMSEEKLLSCVSFSGIIAPYEYLLKNYKTSPDFLLIHGNKDNQVRYEAMEFTKKNLEEMNCSVKTITIDEGLHRIYANSVTDAIEYIRDRI